MSLLSTKTRNINSVHARAPPLTLGLLPWKTFKNHGKFILKYFSPKHPCVAFLSLLLLVEISHAYRSPEDRRTNMAYQRFGGNVTHALPPGLIRLGRCPFLRTVEGMYEQAALQAEEPHQSRPFHSHALQAGSSRLLLYTRRHNGIQMESGEGMPASRRQTQDRQPGHCGCEKHVKHSRELGQIPKSKCFPVWTLDALCQGLQRKS